jgi:two-component system, LuxR family, response regulator FixJ
MDDQPSLLVSTLTPREGEVMRLAALGLPNKAIGRQLDLSDRTVGLHLHRVYEKIGVANRTALVAALARTRT